MMRRLRWWLTPGVHEQARHLHHPLTVVHGSAYLVFHRPLTDDEIAELKRRWKEAA